jgi:foldase protein PrsA
MKRTRYYQRLTMKARRLTPALGAFFVLALSVAGCGGSVPGDAVVNMAGNPITTAAFNHWMYVAAKGQQQAPNQPVIVPNDPPSFAQCIAQARKEIPQLADPKKFPDSTLRTDCKGLFTTLSGQVLDVLIKSYWYQAEAAKQHINVTDAEVQKEFNKDKKQAYPTDAAYQAFLTQTGFTTADLLFRVRITLIFQKLLAKLSAKVTPAQIQGYYNSHLSSYGTPESRDIRIVLTKTLAQANAAKAALDAGKSWNAVAKKYSTDATTKDAGGLLTGVTKGQEEQALDKAAFSAPQGKVLGPVHGQFGYYVYEVANIHPATQQTLAQATPIIKSTLTSEQETAAQTAIDARAKKDFISQTKCRSDYSMADCSGYKAPTTSSPTTTSGTSSTG